MASKTSAHLPGSADHSPAAGQMFRAALRALLRSGYRTPTAPVHTAKTGRVTRWLEPPVVSAEDPHWAIAPRKGWIRGGAILKAHQAHRFDLGTWWPGAGSNGRPSDFQSPARRVAAPLPATVGHHRFSCAAVSALDYRRGWTHGWTRSYASSPALTDEVRHDQTATTRQISRFWCDLGFGIATFPSSAGRR